MPPAERWVLGVGGGALLALAALFAASALGLETQQTGSSAGKVLFFAVWLCWLGYCLLDARVERALAMSIGAAGCLSCVAAALWFAGRAGLGGVEVTIGLGVIGLLLCDAGRRLAWPRSGRPSDAR